MGALPIKYVIGWSYPLCWYCVIVSTTINRDFVSVIVAADAEKFVIWQIFSNQSIVLAAEGMNISI